MRARTVAELDAASDLFCALIVAERALLLRVLPVPGLCSRTRITTRRRCCPRTSTRYTPPHPPTHLELPPLDQSGMRDLRLPMQLHELFGELKLNCVVKLNDYKYSGK